MSEFETDVKKLDGCINTFTRKKVNLLDPSPEQIDIQDIAKGLAYKAHFSGQTPFYFSIAQHSCLVCDLIPRQYTEANPIILMEALLHDGSEAYIGDMVKPLKVHLPDFQRIETKLQQVVFEAFGLTGEYKKFIKTYDIQSQNIEYQCFYRDSDFNLKPLSPDESYFEFLRRYEIYKKLIEKWQK